MMVKNILLFIFGVILVTQLCDADSVDDAEAALNLLRQATSDNLNGGFLEHTKMSIEVDNVALDTKESGLKSLKTKATLLKKIQKIQRKFNNHKLDEIVKAAADDLNSCVNDQADQAITLIYDKSSALADTTLETIYDEEKKIVVCGRSDEDCLSDVVAEINDKIAGLPDVINDEIELDRQAVEEQIDLIKACAAEAIQKLKNL